MKNPLPDPVILGSAIVSVNHKYSLNKARHGLMWYRIEYKENVMEWAGDEWLYTGLHITDLELWWHLPHQHRFEVYYGYDTIEEILVLKTLEKHSSY